MKSMFSPAYSALRRAVMAALCAGLSACAVGPDYVPPVVDVGEGYKEAAVDTSAWTPAQPRDDHPRGEWWRIYEDSTLDGLMTQLNIANQNVAQAEANYRQALALVRNARSDLFPLITTGASLSRAGSGNGTSGSGSTPSSGGGPSNQYTASGTVSWEPDVWGRVRRNIESQQANVQASVSDLATARLSAQSALAQNYFQLRILDEQARLLAQTVAAYERSLKLTSNRYDAGLSARADIAVATTQLESTRAQAIDLEWQRAQFEHAIAVLIGVPPSRFTLVSTDFGQAVPQIPTGLPSALLERRPDVAAAERRMAQANAQIGVAKAAWFPNLTLSADGGFRSGQFAEWLTAPARFWSLGPQLAATIFDGGLRASQVEQAEASYDGQVAAYRQTVLSALGEVEDYLGQMRVFEREQVVQNRALASSRESLRLTRNQYESGLIDYLNVATIQATALSNERTALNLIGNRLTASVQLIAALGGGWDGVEQAMRDAQPAVDAAKR